MKAVCGRYSLYEIEEINERFNVKVPADVKPNYNVAPTQTMPVIRNVDSSNTMALMRWGIPRMLGKDFVKEIINTRSDKAFGGFWRKTVENQRCLVPANSFFEWQKREDGKIPFRIYPKERELFAFAGIWSTWKDKEGNEIETYSIMTTDPNKEMVSVHNRMPVILYPEQESKWLETGLTHEELSEMMMPSADGRLEMYEERKTINNVRNNSFELIGPINSK
jgi:putative SOS response-associated peptidase YedK